MSQRKDAKAQGHVLKHSSQRPGASALRSIPPQSTLSSQRNEFCGETLLPMSQRKDAKAQGHVLKTSGF